MRQGAPITHRATIQKIEDMLRVVLWTSKATGWNMRTWTTWARLITNYNVYDDILRGYYESTSIDYRERWKEDIYRTMIYWSRAKIWEDLGNTSLQLKILLIVFSSVRYYHDIFSTKVLINEIFISQILRWWWYWLLVWVGIESVYDKSVFMKRQWNSMILIDILWYFLIFFHILWYPLIFVDMLWHSLIFFDIFSIFLNIFLDNL